MALPTTLSIATRIQYFPAVSPPPVAQLFGAGGPTVVPSPQVAGVAAIPTGNPQQSPPDCVGSGPLPGLCISVLGASPDFLGSVFAVFDADGSVKIRSRVISTATWQGNGSPAGVAHFSLVDLAA